MRICRADFNDPRLAEFLQAHLDDTAPTAPPESRHALDLAALRAPTVRMWVVYEEEDLVGTGALAELEQGHDELKSMRIDPRRRRRGIARRLLGHLVDDARSRGVTRVSLETGSMEFFTPARRLYAEAGFAPCQPFGRYVADPNSTFMMLGL